MKRVGLFGGSFNPVHTGHLILADHIRQSACLDEVWFVVSPENPFKSSSPDLVEERLRLAMTGLAVSPYEGLEVCDVELSLPRPSYTVRTLEHLRTIYPDIAFSLIIGADSYASFDRWKESDRIIEMTERIYVYPRVGVRLPETAPAGFEFVRAPLVEISSTSIRERIRNGGSVNFLIPDNVYSYIKKHKIFGIE